MKEIFKEKLLKEIKKKKIKAKDKIISWLCNQYPSDYIDNVKYDIKGNVIPDKFFWDFYVAVNEIVEELTNETIK